MNEHLLEAKSLETLFQDLCQFLRKKVITDTPNLDAKLLFEHIVGCYPSAHVPLFLSKKEKDLLLLCIERYCRYEPVSRIIGKRYFWEGRFSITPNTFDPRPETETILEVITCLFHNDKPMRIVDWGTGSGCLLLSLLSHYPRAVGIGLDQSSRAIEVAKKNASQQNLTNRASLITACDSHDLLQGETDIFVSNPPYIPTGEIHHLPRAVVDYDPFIALDGGYDGLCLYRKIIPEAKRLLSHNGTIVLEIGSTQAKAVTNLLEDNSFHHITIHQDLAGHDRCIMAKSLARHFPKHRS